MSLRLRPAGAKHQSALVFFQFQGFVASTLRLKFNKIFMLNDLLTRFQPGGLVSCCW